MLIDTHLHLDFERFDDDRREVLDRAAEAGIDKMITIGIDLPTSEAAIKLTDSYPNVYASVGVHPTEATKFDEQTLATLQEMTRHPKVVAVGEVGLDYYWKDVAPAQQDRVFREMIALSHDVDLPLIIHNREASDDIINVLNNCGTNPYGVMHCFSGDKKMLRDSLALGFYISFAGNLTYKKSTLPDLVPDIPVDRLLVETDAPFLPPVPHRGQRNEPAFVQYTAARVAELIEYEKDKLGELTSHNAHALFKKLSN